MGLRSAATLIRPTAEWTVVGTSSANAALQVSKAAVAAKRHYVTAFEVSVITADVTGDVEITLEAGTTEKWKTSLGDSAVRGDRCGITFDPPMEFPVNTAVNLEVGAAGASAVTVGNITGYTR
jgi:hypothetical protein